MSTYCDHESPKKVAASGQRWAEKQRRAHMKRTACLWILATALPFLMLKLIFSCASPFYFPSSLSETREADLSKERELPAANSHASGSSSALDIRGSGQSRSASPKKLITPSRDEPTAAPEAVNPRHILTPGETSGDEEDQLDSPQDNEKKEAEKWKAPPYKKRLAHKEAVEQVTSRRTASPLVPADSKECDLYDGDWVEDPEGPLYTNETCFYKHAQQDCMTNGRPDTGYLYWKWKPRHCELPRFDAKAFLDMFRGKTIAFVGDSLSRNQMQSLLCMLSQFEIPNEIFKSPDDRSVRWLFRTHRVTLATVWSPYLLKETAEELKGIGEGESKLFMDTLDEGWTSVMNGFDVMVLSIGQWYLKPSIFIENDQIIGCHYCPERKLTEIGFLYSYRKGVRHTLDKVTNDYRGLAILTSLSLDHFENGSWSSGGSCRRELPFKKGEKVLEGLNYEMYKIVVEEYQDFVRRRKRNRKKFQLDLLDVTLLSLLRGDGHPGPFRSYHPFDGKLADTHVQNDCLHWCLPGPIDTWNQVLLHTVQSHL
ncbi:hypothetical protein R1sor_025983 [Riccia sorocarpa]|uniref:Trichome birefringence-like N-terminal domain-containing protein n=1 Tax=Riccia sorocarpa TaxID=122646 RepID=A0ABD3GA61_9MARC